MSEPRRRDVTLGLGRVSVLEWGPVSPAGTLLLLHGGGVDDASLSWGDLAPRLGAAGFRVVAPDHPGYGDSPLPPWPATQERLVAYVGDLVDELGLEHYVVGGLSLGGGMALGHTLARPGSVAGLMLLGTYGIMPRMGTGPTARLTHLLAWATVRSGLMLPLMRSAATPARMAKVLRQIVRDPARRTPDLVAEVVAAAGRPDAMAAFSQWQLDQVRWGRLRTDDTEELRRIGCPTLIVHGDHDAGVPVARARLAASLIPDATLVVAEGAGHWVQRDAPDLTYDAVTAFLASLTDPCRLAR